VPACTGAAAGEQRALQRALVGRRAFLPSAGAHVDLRSWTKCSWTPTFVPPQELGVRPANLPSTKKDLVEKLWRRTKRGNGRYERAPAPTTPDVARPLVAAVVAARAGAEPRQLALPSGLAMSAPALLASTRAAYLDSQFLSGPALLVCTRTPCVDSHCLSQLSQCIGSCSRRRRSSRRRWRGCSWGWIRTARRRVHPDDYLGEVTRVPGRRPSWRITRRSKHVPLEGTLGV